MAPGASARRFRSYAAPGIFPPVPALRVLHLDSGREWRSVQRQLLLLAEAQRAGDLEPVVVAPRAAPLVRRARAAGLASAAVTVRAELDVVAARRVRRLVRMWRPDLVHAHDARAHGVALIALLGRDVPLVVTRWSAARIPARAALRFAPRAQHFVAVTHAAAAALRAASVPADRVHVVPPGLAGRDTAACRDWREELRWPDSALVCGVLGSVDADGEARLVGALTRVPTPVRLRLRLVRFGGGAAGAHLLAGVPAVRVGFVDDMAAAIAGLDLLCDLSTSERLALAVLEALAVGTPAVAVARGGIGELARDGESALLVAPEPLATLDARTAAAITRLAGDAALRARLVAAAAPLVRSLTVARMARGVREVYARAIAARDATRGATRDSTRVRDPAAG